jgi:hypothetical protein
MSFSYAQIYALVCVFNEKKMGTQLTSRIVWMITGYLFDPDEIWAISQGFTFDQWRNGLEDDCQEVDIEDDYPYAKDDFGPEDGFSDQDYDYDSY